MSQLDDININEVVLDEGFAYDKEKLAKIYYTLGVHKLKVEAYGTII